MIKSRLIHAGLVATSISLLAACAPEESPTTPASPSPGASAAPSAAPTTAPTSDPTPSADPGTEPGTEPTTAPTTAPTSEPGATATPLPPATSDISVIERTTFNGQVFDDTNAPLNGVTVTAKSLNPSVSFEESTTTAGGAYAFNNAPAGVQIEITASRAGYTTRRRVEVLKSNKQGDPNANKYDFGTDGSGNKNITGNTNNALSDKPEVVSITPGRNASGIAPNTSFVVRFSEPMDTKTVEDNFVIGSFTQETLTVDNNVTFAAGGFTIGETGAANEKPKPGTQGTKVWNKDAFSFSWNGDETEVTLTFSNERMLPTDKETANAPDYYVTFTEDDNQIKDKSGVTRDSNYFKLTDGRFEGAAKFSIQTDRTSPTVRSITAQTAENSGASSDGDAVKVLFSERMVHYTSGAGVIAGGRDGIASKAVAANNSVNGMQAANNYELLVTRAGSTIQSPIKWSAFRGQAIFDTNDATHKTVKLLPGTAVSRTTVAGRPANGDTIDLNLLLADGTTSAATTFAFVTTSNSASDITFDGDATSNFFVSRNSVSGATAAGDVITVSFTYADGSTEANVASGALVANATDAQVQTALTNMLGSGSFRVERRTAASPANPGSFANGNTIRVMLNSGATRDGKTIAWVNIARSGAFAETKLGGTGTFPFPVSGGLTLVAHNSDHLVLQAMLNRSLTGTQTNKFTVTENQGRVGFWEANDIMNISLNGSPMFSGQAVRMASLTQSGALTSTKLNAPATGLYIYPGVNHNAGADLYKPGDTVRITVSSSVMDPAGNTLDSSRNNASATAS